MDNDEGVQLISGVWYKFTVPPGKEFEACCVITEEGEGTRVFFEFSDESRKAADDILPYVSQIEAIETPGGDTFSIIDFLEEGDDEELPLP
jgi:hypothetical protein